MESRTGHFRLESGHHTDSWLELDSLFQRPATLRPFVSALAERLARHGIDLVCGPLLGGAFLAQMIAADLDVEFSVALRMVSDRPGLYPVDYRIAPALRGAVRGKHVAVVDDAISAGSAVRATLADLQTCGAHPVALGALVLVGERAETLARDQRLPLERLVQLPNGVWVPTECPMCALGAPVTDP